MKYVRFTVRITQSLNDLLDKEAKNLGLTKNALVITILNEYVSKSNELKHRKGGGNGRNKIAGI